MSLLFSGSYVNGVTFDYANTQDELTIIDVNQIINENLNTTELNSYYDWAIKVQIESLRATYWLGSTLNRINYSEIYPEDSQATRIAKITEQESSQRIGLKCYRQKGDNIASKIYLAGQLFQNIGREQQKELLDPFLARSNVKLLGYSKSTGIGDRLIYKLHDYGDGLIASYGDYIQIECDAVYFVTGVRKELISTRSNSFGEVVTNVPKLILPANNQRVKVNLANSGNNTISFHYGDQADLVIGKTLELPPGSSWSDQGLYVDRGDLWAVAHSGESLILGKESELF